MFADVERACAVLGFNPNDREIWEIAAALGVHRPEADETIDQFSPNPMRMDADLREMVNAQLAADAGGPEPQWSQAISPDMN